MGTGEASGWIETTEAASERRSATNHGVKVLDYETLLMAMLWLFIGAVAAYDVYLSVKYQETLRFQELNPLGRWLLDLDGGSVAVFMGCKFLGTLIVLGVIQLLYVLRRRMALAVAVGLAAVQAALGAFLIFY